MIEQSVVGVAEFQKIHDEMSALRAAGKFEETAKFSTDDAVFVTPLHDKPYTKKGYYTSLFPVNIPSKAKPNLPKTTNHSGQNRCC